MINWEFYSKRRGISLKDFLSDVKNLDEAKNKFKEKNISCLPDEDIQGFLSTEPDEKKVKTTELPSRQKVEKPKKNRSNIDLISVAVSTKETETEKKPRKKRRNKKTTPDK
jgi:hypothetical protein